MRICIVAEGCYPYVVGGVSSWVHNLIRAFPAHEFVVLAIVADRSLRGKFVYELPDNVVEVREVYLQDVDWSPRRRRRSRRELGKEDYEILKSLLLNRDVRWFSLFDLFRDDRISVNDVLMGEGFMDAAREVYEARRERIPYSDYLWTVRSIYLPLFLVLKTDIPKADLYHCVATGYAGVLGSMAKALYGCKLLVSEHGLYTREREEELIKATWVQQVYKDIWVEQFRKMSTLAYTYADKVTSLFAHSRDLQVEMGCPAEKTQVTPNGVDPARFEGLPGKRPEEEGLVNVGAVVRVTPIKDVKTLINAFYFAHMREGRLRLWIMGPVDEDPDYFEECQDLIEALGATDIEFTGRIDVTQWLGRMDMCVLTSLSEGQPLSILESFAAHKPVIATDVGNCRGLLYGEEGDDLGAAGVLTHIMDVQEISDAMVDLARDEELRARMGEVGHERMMRRYRYDQMVETYARIYRTFSDELGLSWPDDGPSGRDDSGPVRDVERDGGPASSPDGSEGGCSDHDRASDQVDSAKLNTKQEVYTSGMGNHEQCHKPVVKSDGDAQPGLDGRGGGSEAGDSWRA